MPHVEGDSSEQSKLRSERLVENDRSQVEIMSNTLRIVMLALSVVLICVSAGFVLVVVNERATQNNADRQERINATLTRELECLRQPAFEADKADAELNILVARGLASLTRDDRGSLATLADDLDAGSIALENAIQAQGESITACERQSVSNNPLGTTP